MTKYCPLCESEYQDSVTSCSEDGEKLFNAPAAHLDRAIAVDIYAAADEIEAECIVEFLADDGIDAKIFRPQVSAFPNLGDTHFIISVRSPDKKTAIEAIKNARNESGITTSGMFL